MYSKNNRNRWVLFLFLLAGMVLGAFLGDQLARYPYMDWLGYGQSLGLTNPATFSAGVLSLTLGFTFKLNIGGVIGLGLGVAAYKLSNRL